MDQTRKREAAYLWLRRNQPYGDVIEDELSELRARAEAAEARVAELEAAIRNARKMATGRWCEWGDRAEGVAEILAAALGEEW